MECWIAIYYPDPDSDRDPVSEAFQSEEEARAFLQGKYREGWERKDDDRGFILHHFRD